MKKNIYWILGAFFIVFLGLAFASQSTSQEESMQSLMFKLDKMKANQDTIKELKKTEKEWKDQLSGMEFKVLREKGTERAFSGEYWDHFENGKYTCKACGLELFESNTKFDAHCGWPSFYDAINSKNIKTADDYILGYRRTELMCAKCEGHLGHVFEDGPAPTGLRYCINSASIKFEDEKESQMKKD